MWSVFSTSFIPSESTQAGMKREKERERERKRELLFSINFISPRTNDAKEPLYTRSPKRAFFRLQQKKKKEKRPIEKRDLRAFVLFLSHIHGSQTNWIETGLLWNKQPAVDLIYVHSSTGWWFKNRSLAAWPLFLNGRSIFVATNQVTDSPFMNCYDTPRTYVARWKTPTSFRWRLSCCCR